MSYIVCALPIYILTSAPTLYFKKEFGSDILFGHTWYADICCDMYSDIFFCDGIHSDPFADIMKILLTFVGHAFLQIKILRTFCSDNFSAFLFHIFFVTFLSTFTWHFQHQRIWHAFWQLIVPIPRTMFVLEVLLLPKTSKVIGPLESPKTKQQPTPPKKRLFEALRSPPHHPAPRPEPAPFGRPSPWLEAPGVGASKCWGLVESNHQAPVLSALVTKKSKKRQSSPKNHQKSQEKRFLIFVCCLKFHRN